ncbi:SIR2 family protein [Flavobacterium sp. MK4S-17]|uniref:SIR2 family NAD-dependent protein deacylase n=1 Tax=Flavobacterium sp. MK4S-17 TaxID=2543737 RepID=UPI00135A59C7|nr:SIR2 family protein [Flavobacterium sp. MK4S-17]
MEVIPKLREAYVKGAFGIYIGAGISRSSGLPNWKDLLIEMINLAYSNTLITNDKREELIQLTDDSNNFLLVAEDLKDILGSDLPKFFKKRFDDKSLVPSDTLCDIIKIKNRFIITTNYDTLIEKAYAKVYHESKNPLTYKNASAVNYNILTNEHFLLKAHGDAGSAANEIILTEKDYRNIIFKEKGYQSVLHVLFSTCNVLFFGASLKDPELKLLLGYIHNIFHGGSPDHFALMNKNEITNTEVSRWRKDYNINIIPFDPRDNYIEIQEYVAEIIKI